MKYLVAIIMMLGLQGISHAQTPMGEITKAVIKWDWTQGTGGAADGFIVRCGPRTREYTNSIRVPDKSVRSYIMLAMDRAINWDCKSGQCIGQAFCTVVAYNKIGESTEDAAGVPVNPTQVHYEMIR